MKLGKTKITLSALIRGGKNTLICFFVSEKKCSVSYLVKVVYHTKTVVN